KQHQPGRGAEHAPALARRGGIVERRDQRVVRLLVIGGFFAALRLDRRKADGYRVPAVAVCVSVGGLRLRRIEPGLQQQRLSGVGRLRRRFLRFRRRGLGGGGRGRRLDGRVAVRGGGVFRLRVGFRRGA